MTHPGQFSHSSNKGTLPAFSLPPSCSSFSVHMQLPIATILPKRVFFSFIYFLFFRGGLLWKISFLLFTASTSFDHGGRCNAFAPEPRCDESQPEVESGEGGIGCCTCLLPWGFWRSDYAGCGMEDLFSRGMLGKKKEKRKERKRKEKGVHELESQSAIIWRAFVLDRYGGFARTMSEDCVKSLWCFHTATSLSRLN